MTTAAKTSKASGAEKSPKYDPETLYEVALARPVKVGRSVLLPQNINRIVGKRLNEIAAEDVLDAKEL